MLLQIWFHKLDTTGTRVSKVVKREAVQNVCMRGDQAPGVPRERVGRWEAGKITFLMDFPWAPSISFSFSLSKGLKKFRPAPSLWLRNLFSCNPAAVTSNSMVIVVCCFFSLILSVSLSDVKTDW